MLTPKDIETKSFKVSLKGYNVAEVDDFLQEICDSYLEIYESNKALKEKAERLSSAVGQYKSMEDTITDAARIADKNAYDIESDANVKAKLIIENAELTARSIVAGAEQKVSEETYRLESIKREVELYKNKIVELLNAQLSILKGYPQSGSIGIDITPTHTPQMWKKKEEPQKEEVKEEKVYEDAEKTRKFKPQSDFDVTEDLSLNIEDDDTDKLPCVKLDDNGEYIITENN